MSIDATPPDGVEELTLGPTGSELAARVVGAVRRRRRALAVAAVAVLLPAALVVAVVLRGGHRSSPGAAGDSDRVAVYLAATADAGPVSAVYVDDPAVTAADRRALRRALGARVHFGVSVLPPLGGSRRTVLLFGQLHLTGHRATLARSTLCGPLCLEGKTLVLQRRDGRWQVTGSTGPQWIS